MLLSNNDNIEWETDERFQSLKKKIFSTLVNDANAIFVGRVQDAGYLKILTTRIRKLSDFSQFVSEAVAESWQDTFLIIPQEYSWGRLNFTYASFKLLMHSWSIFDSFIQIVSAFGFKTSDDERLESNCWSKSPPNNNSGPKLEICYNILHVQRHGRDLVDPWSLRQTGVYHQPSQGLTPARWILLNPPDVITSRLQSTEWIRSHMCGTVLHYEILSLLSSNWAAYIDYLDSEWRNYNDKASYAKVGVGGKGYQVSYTDVQELHALQLKTHRAEKAIQSSLAISQVYLNNLRCCEQNVESHLKTSLQHYHGRAHCHSSSMLHYADQLNGLKWRLQSTLDLLLNLIAVRNQELLHNFNRASLGTLEALLKITEQGKLQQDSLAHLLRQGRADSSLLRSLSIVATLCLPASLVASIFSSSLIQEVDLTSPEHHTSKLVPSPSFWMYFAITVPLMTCTLACILYLERRTRAVGSNP